MAVEIGENGSDTDPNDGKPLENATPDAAGKGIDQQGQGATGSAVTDADLAENKVEDYVSKFQAYKYPMHTDFLKLAKQHEGAGALQYWRGYNGLRYQSGGDQHGKGR